MQDPTYPVMEHFPTLQGEGYYTGRSAYFVRLSGCDIGCVWCDVKESWEITSGNKLTVSEIVEFVGQHDFVVLTGGEPAMHDLSALTAELRKQGKWIALETSGCYPLQGKVDWYTFSPKKFKPPCDEAYLQAHELKVVIYRASDLLWAQEHANKVTANCLLYLQPEWSKSETITEEIITFIQRNPRWRLSLQTHKYLNIP